MKYLTIIIILLSFISGLVAQGRLIIPEPPSHKFKPEQVYLKSVNASIAIRQGVGNVKLEQIFYNKSAMQLEGEYLFALGDEAEIHDFYLYIDGKRSKGQMLDSKEAFNIYTDIVRKLRDPALLEYVGERLFKAHIFPILPQNERKIELSYVQVLGQEAGLYRFDLPIRQSGQGAIESYHLTIDLQSDRPLGNIHSPSHTVNIQRLNERQATISFEATNLEAAKNFTLIYSLANQEINGNLLSFRPRTDRDGYFMFIASPKHVAQPQKNLPKDVIFVIDVSGSMEGEKIEQAKEALRFCVNTLDQNDRFEIVSFSSDLNSFQGRMNEAKTDVLQNARYFIDNLVSSGGTNINEALQLALKLKDKGDERPTSLIFLTDGLPTEGEQDIGKIIKNVKDQKRDFMRIFCFGVGYDVNTFLLDQLANESHGAAQYVKEGENIESAVSTFFAKISAPVLTDTRIGFADVNIYDVYPHKLPDIFKGQHLIIFGRYRKPAKTTIELFGQEGNKTRSFQYDIELEEREQDSEFISKLWANRKVAHLLTKIRFEGENPELVESIRKLGKEYGIVTPYTSYLVTEQKEELAAMEQLVLSGGGGFGAVRFSQTQQARDLKAETDEEAIGGNGFFESLSQTQRNAAQSSGKGAVMSSRAIQKVAESEAAEDMLLTVRRCADRGFSLKKSVWMEEGLENFDKADKIIKFLSDEYFSLSKESSELRAILSLGSEIIFRWNGKIYRIEEK